MEGWDGRWRGTDGGVGGGGVINGGEGEEVEGRGGKGTDGG